MISFNRQTIAFLPEDRIYHDRQILALIAKGDEGAFAELFFHYKDKLYSFLLQFTDAAAAEDIVQDVFLKIWTNREKMPEVKSVSSYIFTIGKNFALDVLKRKLIYQGILSERGTDLTPGGVDTEELIRLNELKTKVHNCVEQLPPQQKKVYQLSREEGLKVEEIAQRLGLSQSTVKNHMVAALRSLRDKLGTEYPAAVLGLILAIAELLKK